MQKKLKYRKIFALLLALVMLTAIVPVATIAEPVVEATEAPAEPVAPKATQLPEAEDEPPQDTPTPSADNGEEEIAEPTELPPATEPPMEDVPPTELPPESEPPMEDVPSTELPEETPLPDQEENTPPTETVSASLEDIIATYGHAYVMTAGEVMVYTSATMTDAERSYTITQTNAVLLATAYAAPDGHNSVMVWFITSENAVMSGYVDAAALADAVLSDAEAYALTDSLAAGIILCDVGEMPAFIVEGESAIAPPTEAVNSEVSAEPTVEQPTPTVEEAAQPFAQVGDFIAVSPQTRVFMGMDDGEQCVGVFVRDASVQIEAVEQDSLERHWYKVRYLYGDDFADGTLKWTEYDSVYVLAAETAISTEQECTLTDYAFETVPASSGRLRSASAMNGFSLKSINAPVPSLYVGQSGVYGSSGKDSDYLQIAKSADHGTIYATPHYLDGYTVYCLEHTLSGPGENISGGGQQPKGPYLIVDIDSYRNNPGYSSIIYHDSTLHAIAWILRHSYPFMVLDRSDSDNEVWSRVAGQFAIRQVIRELEGAQYVRPYWNMDNFYRASGQAPAVYLEYARWLASNGIARGNITGNINVSGKSTTASGSSYVGTVTLTTDADQMRVSRAVGNLTGNTAGADSAYYYLNSGDTISVSSTRNNFTIVVESVSTADEEANFLVGVPSVEIQKVLIPQYGAPTKMQAVSIQFEIPFGAINVTKKASASGAALAGATFELLSSGGAVIQTQTTGANGIASFVNLQPGSYTVREAGAPSGYLIATTNMQGVTVTAGNTSHVLFANDSMTAKIKIMKKDQLTGEALAGAEFTITRLSAPSGSNGAGIGSVVAVLTTDADGSAETGWLEWGRYRVTETKVPPHFVDNHFSTEIEAYENGKTYAIEVKNEPTKGFIRLVKTDRLNGNPIEGVRFDIFHNDEYGSGLAATMVTGKDGVAISEPLRKGRYIVREHGETAGYAFEEITLNATVKSDDTTELTATNQPVRVKLKLYKRDAEEYGGEIGNTSTRGDGVLIGSEFQVLAGEAIKDRQGNVLYAEDDVVIASLKTAGEDASVTTSELWPGLYKIVELTPPVGYQPSEKPISVDARSAALQSQEAVITYEGVKTNTILYGALEIVKFLGNNQEHVGSGVIETPEAGAKFEVFLKRAGSYENARDIERDHLKTNRYGKARTKALPYGVYVLRQTVGKEGHALMAPIDFMIDGSEDLKDPPSLILNNQAIQYRLRIIKLDAETGKPVALAGTAFQLRDADGNLVTQTVSYPTPMEIDTFLTNDNGEVMLPETVTWGQYFIEEVKSPEGYLLNVEPVEVFVGHAGDAADQVYEVAVEVSNEPVKGNIIVEKKGLQLAGFEAQTDAFGNEYQQPIYEEKYLAGAVFELRAAEQIIGKDGIVWYEQDALADTITTTADGANASIALPLGKYYLREIETPAGYVAEQERYEVELVFTDNQTAIVEIIAAIGNTYIPAEISLQKEKEAIQTTDDGNGTVRQVIVNVPGEGFVFGLYTDKDIHCSGGTLVAGTLVATGVTASDGNLTFAGHYPHGDYYIKELSTPKGWKLNPNRFAITLDPVAKAEDANIIRVSLSEAIHNELVYSEITLTKTDITGENTIPGALIEVRNSADEVIYLAYTDANGQIPNIPVTPGWYSFREILAPDGYALNEATLIFAVDEAGNVTGDTVIRDEYTRFSLRKQDEKGEPLAGVEFALLKEDGSTLMTALSDENGLVTFEKIPYGNYTIVETQPLAGYLPSGTQIQLTVDGAYVNPDQPVTIVNVPNHYAFLKVDNEGNPLAGVKFALEDTAGNTLRELMSGEDGVVHVTDLERGSYTIRETEALEGYIRSEDTIELVMDDNYRMPDELVRLVNYPGIQTGVEIVITPVMWAGAVLMLGGVAVLFAYGARNKKKKRRKQHR